MNPLLLTFRLLAQVWADFQYKLNKESELYGNKLDPLDVDAKMPEVSNSLIFSEEAKVKMKNQFRDLPILGLDY